MNRNQILDKVLELYSEIEQIQIKINKLVELAENTTDKEDDESEKQFRFSALSSIQSYKK